MDTQKDYYRILGVLDDAEDIVIKAAYRALAQRYHPDKWQGDSAEAAKRMAGINEAYSILSDESKKREYDSCRQNNNFTPDPTEGGGENDYLNEINEKWDTAKEYLKDLDEIFIGLQRISASLAFTYKLTILESKGFDKRDEIAKRLEDLYLTKYFGSNIRIKNYAKNLILDGRKNASKELNKAVCVLGNNLDVNQLLNAIENKFPPVKKEGNEFDWAQVFANDFFELSKTEKDEKIRRYLCNKVEFSNFNPSVKAALKSYASSLGFELKIIVKEVPHLIFFTIDEQFFVLKRFGTETEMGTSEFLKWLRNT